MKDRGSHSITLKAKKAGKATITATASDVSNGSGSNEVTGSKSVTITVNEPKKEPDATEATLKSITVAGKTYPNPNTDISITVGADVSIAQISAVANNSGAKISGTGNKELKTGTNTVTITVTGPNGATKSYTVRIRKLADTSNNQPNVPNNKTEQPKETEPEPEQEPEPQLLRLSYLTIEDVEMSPEFNSEVFEYSAAVTNVENIEIVAVANYDDAKIEIIGDKNLSDGENEVIVKVTKNDEEEVSYKIVVTKTTVNLFVGEETSTDNTTTGGSFLSTTVGKIVAGIGGVIVIGVLGFILWRVKTASGITSHARRSAARRASFDDFDD